MAHEEVSEIKLLLTFNIKYAILYAYLCSLNFNFCGGHKKIVSFYGCRREAMKAVAYLGHKQKEIDMFSSHTILLTSIEAIIIGFLAWAPAYSICYSGMIMSTLPGGTSAPKGVWGQWYYKHLDWFGLGGGILITLGAAGFMYYSLIRT